MIFLADCGPEKIMKMLLGRKDVEEALLRLDVLTKEESLMMLARNLEVTQHADRVIHDVDNGTQHFLSVLMHIPTLFLFPSCPNIVTHELKRLSLPDTPIVGRQG